MPKILETTFARGLALPMLAFAIVLPCHAGATLSTAYSFTNLGDGGFPEAGLLMSSSGALYGTTSSGGAGWGSVFELVPSGSTWTETTLYDFTGGPDGGNPIGDLVIGKSGVLYGTTNSGGANGYGTVFQVAPVAGGGWSQKVLYSFAGGNDGAYPAAGLAMASTGALFGTTYSGGSSGLGTVFEMLPSKSGWTEKVIYTFLGGTDGANPVADLVIGSSGSLFGTTSQGGSVTNSSGTFSNWGTAFELTQTKTGWVETILYTFTGSTDGGAPESPLIIGPSNVLYGSTFWGGNDADCPIGDYLQGCGTVYELLPPGGTRTGWTETVLATFTGHNADGSHPYGALGRNSGGQLFGTTYSGGASVNVCLNAYTGCGTIFYIKPPAKPGGTWTKTNIQLFPGSPGGGTPNGVIIGTSGTLYGTTTEGGNAGGYGTVFVLTLP